MASQPLLPGETIMRALCARKDHFRCARPRGGRRWPAYLDALVSHELETSAPVLSTAPIAPEQRGRTHLERMQQHTDLARFCRRSAIPLTLLTQRTGTTTADAGRIHHAQTAIGFWTPFLGVKRLSCWTAESSIRLERKVLAREAPRFPGGGRGRRAIPRCVNG